MSYAPQRVFALEGDDGQLLTNKDGSIMLFKARSLAQQEADARPEAWTVYTITY